MKRLLTIILCLCMLFSLAACGKDGKDGLTPTIEISADGYWVINGEKTNVKATSDGGASTPENPQGLDFYLKDDGTYAVAVGNAKYLSKIVIPSTYLGKAVTEIAYDGFKSCQNLTEVVISDSVTSIGEWAFLGCSRLSKVTIPDSVTYVGEHIFDGSPKLLIYCEAAICPSTWASNWNGTSYPIVWDYKNNNVASDGYIYTEIGGAKYGVKDGTAVFSAQLSNDCNVIIPSTISYNGATHSVTSIGRGAFVLCTNLTSVTIPDGVTSIGSSAFYGCSNLTSVTIGNRVTSIGEYAFSGCSSLTSVVIPDGATYIGNYAFYGCSNLTSVTIGNGVTSIGNYAFEGCTSLASVTMPDSVTYIGDRAFYSCTNLTTINYRGTEEQWNAISKVSYWNYNTGNYTIVYNYNG